MARKMWIICSYEKPSKEFVGLSPAPACRSYSVWPQPLQRLSSRCPMRLARFAVHSKHWTGRQQVDSKFQKCNIDLTDSSTRQITVPSPNISWVLFTARAAPRDQCVVHTAYDFCLRDGRTAKAADKRRSLGFFEITSLKYMPCKNLRRSSRPRLCLDVYMLDCSASAEIQSGEPGRRKWSRQGIWSALPYLN